MTDLIKIEKDIVRINNYISEIINILNIFDDLTKYMTTQEKLDLYNTNAYYYTVNDYLKDINELEYMYNGIYNYNMPIKLKKIFYNYNSVNDYTNLPL
jgi:hypothetical protein